MSPAPQGGPPPRIFLDIDAAMRQGATDKAVALARKALDDGLRHPVLFNLRAYGHETAGRFAAACADLQAALALAPGDPRLLNELARCRNSAGEYVAGLTAAGEATRSEPGLAAAHYNLAFAAEQLGDLEIAWSSYQRALALDPALLDAPARLAGLAVRRGDLAQARLLADRVLAAQPGHTFAALAQVSIALAEGRFAEAEAHARAVAAAPATPPQARVSALSLAGDALDGQGRAGDAFPLYSQAKAEMRTLFRPLYEAPGAETGLAVARRLEREFAAIAPSAWQPDPAASPSGGAGDVAFLMGFPRSGTTLIGQILASHPRVVTIEEKPLLGAAVEAFILTSGGLARLAALSQAQLEPYRARFWENVREQGGDTDGKLVVDQTPLHTLHLPVIARLFPQARIIVARRDPRDVVLSCFRRLFAPNPYVYEFLSLDGAARFYDATMRLAGAYGGALPLAAMTLGNEALVADFDGQTAALCDHLGLERSAAMRDFAAVAARRRIATPSALQVVKGLRSDGIGHWRNYAKEMAPVLATLAPWVERFGYAQS